MSKIIKFKQEAWLKQDINVNTKLRKNAERILNKKFQVNN